MSLSRVQTCNNSAQTSVGTTGTTLTLTATFPSLCTAGNIIVVNVGVDIVGLDFAYRSTSPAVKIRGAASNFTQATWNDGVYLGGGSSGIFYGVVPTVTPTQLTVSGKTLPWVSGGGLNTSYNYDQTGGSSPVVFSCSAGQNIAIQYVSGLASIGGGFGSKDANGLALVPSSSLSSTDAGYYVSGNVYNGGLIGAFTDNTGSIVSTVNIGNSATLTVPIGATQLQLGMCDGFFTDNTGAWVINVTTVQQIDFTFTANIDPVPGPGTFTYAVIASEYSGLGSPTTQSTANDPIYGGAGTTPVTLTLIDSKGTSVPVVFTGHGAGSGGPGTDGSISLADLTAGNLLATDCLFACFLNNTGGSYITDLPTTIAQYGAFQSITTATFGGSTLYAWDGATRPPLQGWLIVDEPPSGSPATGGGWTDRSSYLFTGSGGQHNFVLQSRQRGTANYTLEVDASDSYEPTLWQTILLYDQTPSGFTLMFSGVIQSFKHRQIGLNGYRYIDVTAISMEALFDQVMVTTPVSFTNTDCGTIVTTLFNTFESGAPITLGTIQSGQTIPLFNAQVGDKLSDIFTQLATTSEFTWNVNPATLQFFFGAPNVVSAPFSITSPLSMWDSISYGIDGADYRNRQAVKLSYDAFPHSMEYFVGAGQQSFTLMRPVKQVTNAYVTLSTPNTATASFSGQPSAGDTVTIGPASGSWQSGHIYALGGIIVVNGYVQKVTTNGTSGGSIPAFSTITGATTTDNSVIWTCQGPLGLGTGSTVYTFETSIDNTQFGQVLIGANVAATVQNLVDAINANASTRGTTFSLPTWENSQVNAITVTGTGFTVQQKAAGTGWVAQLSSTGTAFSWSAANTSGGTSPQGSVGPNQGATISIQVYQQGTSTAAPGLAYTEGSAVIGLATPLNSGTNLNVEYTRADGDVIQCERTDLVAALAITTHGTGRIQQITDASTLGLTNTNALAGLQLCQQTLASYDVPPSDIEVEILRPGMYPGMQVTVALTGYWSLLNGQWYIEEVRAEFIPFSQNAPFGPYIDQSQAPGGGHYRYTLKLIDVAQIGSYLDWWLRQGGGGGGGSSTGVVATSGGAIATQGVPSINFADGETPSGTINGSNVTFTLAHAPSPAASLEFFINGINGGWTLSGSTVTTTVAPKSDQPDVLQAWYRY